MRSNGAPVEDSCVILARMSRQRCACSRRVLRSPASAPLSCKFLHGLFQFARNQENGRKRRAEFMRGGGGEAIELREVLLAGQHQFGGRERVGQFARLFGDLERIKAGDADRDQDREPDPEQIDRRQLQRLVALPGQRQMEKAQHGCAGNGENTERDGQADRQRRRRDQHRRQKQKRKRILQAAGKIQQSGQFGDVQRQQRRGIDRFQPLHRIEGDLQHQIEQRREADDGDAGDDREIEIEPLHHDKNSRELAEHGKPAQPQNRVQTDIAARMAEIGGCDVGHCGEFSRALRGSQIASRKPAPPSS